MTMVFGMSELTKAIADGTDVRPALMLAMPAGSTPGHRRARLMAESGFAPKHSRQPRRPLSGPENGFSERLIVAARREHSRKPDEAYQSVERLVAGPYLDLFGRQSRPGWTVWGDEATRFDEAAE